MKRFDFRLERVLKWKQQQERLAELRQQQARAAVDRACLEVIRLKEQLARTAVALEAQLGAAVDTTSWIARYDHSAWIGLAIGIAEKRVQEADKHLQEENAQRARLATETEALLHLRRQRWQAHLRDAARDAQEQLDELGLRRWQARSEDGSMKEADRP